MRDLVAREALRDLADEAGERFRELVRAGREIPYEVREPGPDSPFCHYQPLTERFIRDQAPMVASLSAYGPAKSAIVSGELATSYLETFGLDTSVAPGRQAEDAVLVFLCRLWHDSTDFTLEPSRLEAALAEFEDSGDPGEYEVEVVVPVIGMQMDTSRLDLTSVSVARSDVVEAPPEATESAGAGRAEWEPQFLAFARCSVGDLEAPEDSDVVSTAPIAARFHRAITALRLYKAGGVGLAPHGWTRTGGGRWRRIATGAGRPRPGGYRLTDSELSELAAFARGAERRPTRATALGRAISRFEAGLERSAPLEALNDHLLALRFLLEGDGPAMTGMPMRVAALCAPPEGRNAVKRTVERALALERELWSGDPAPGGDARTPVEIAGEVEDLLRAILRDAVCGHLGTDLRAAADEVLLADGLAAGEGDAKQRGGTEEWEPQTPPVEPTVVGSDLGEIDLSVVEEQVGEHSEIRRIEPDPQLEGQMQLDSEPEPETPADPATAAPKESPKLVNDGWTPFIPTAEDSPEERDEFVPPPSAGEAEPLEEPEEPSDDRATMQESEPLWQTGEPMVDRNQAQQSDWLAETGMRETTLDFPERGPAMRLLDQMPEEREARRQRVATLFPVPDTVDWSVGELDYQRRAAAGEQPGA
jgi:hypothetical protein